jgi:hypothetical protein
MESAIRLSAVLLTALLCACAVNKPPPPAAQRIGWKHLDGRPAEGPIVQQVEATCNEAATRSANTGTTLFMQAANSTLNSCMAKQGYLPLMRFAP